jgi:predicted N-formylglutamate amidohydrolase
LGETPIRLLAQDEPAPFTVSNECGRSPFFIACDHAGKSLPRRLGKLGLRDSQLERHIASDIGAGSVSCLVGNALDAFVIRQTYSRLVIDCNRPPGAETSIVELSEATRVPGNIGLSDRQKEARVREIFQPYHDRIVAELDKRRQTGHPTVLVSMHSFTPVFKSVARPWHVGVLYRDPRFAHILMQLLLREDGLVVGDNEPYTIADTSDYTIPVHGEQRGLPHVGLEIRQDQIADEAGQKSWAALLVRLLPEAYRRLAADPNRLRRPRSRRREGQR